jgi:hypothetical protein
MEPLDENTLDEIARLIAGDDGPLYRQGWELPKFFRQAGWQEMPDYDSSPRKQWALDQLCARRHRPEDIEQVVLRLADARVYLGEAPNGQEEAIKKLNAVLIHEGYKIQRPGGRPQIVECDPIDGRLTDAAPVELKTTLAEVIGASALARTLQGRLDEAQTCRANGAYVATIILLGSLLEGVLDVIKKQRTGGGGAPGTDRPTLNDLINAAHRNGWIQADAKNFAHELRNYRNLVHPWREFDAGHAPDRDTVDMCWPVVVATLNDLAATSTTL